ncbi:alkaline ceramidase-like [Chironomus tepperi]|uniref:alkaline ceramidase-like n=1 Tax=Chironomus tepperi TaxID=113505 RepID=UPI00391FACC9
MFIDKEAIYKSLEWHSSPVDWCEPNYAVVPYIVEYYNTLSNIVFLILPPLMMYLYRGYANKINSGIQIVWIFYMIVGASSMYFHGTLSLMGQLLDEISILWVYAIAVSLYCPKAYMPPFARTRTSFSIFIFILNAVFTLLSIWRPYINAFAQMFLVVIPVVTYLYLELQKIKKTDKEVYKLGMRSMFVGLTAVTIWFNDRIFCGFYSSFGITYLHAVWHILSYIASYTACVISTYFYVKYEQPKTPCKISYWPHKDLRILGIPYVEIGGKSGKRKI